VESGKWKEAQMNYITVSFIGCHFDQREKSVLQLKKARFLTYVRNDKEYVRSEWQRRYAFGMAEKGCHFDRREKSVLQLKKSKIPHVRSE
jgi:hypothetical protein